MTIILFPFHIMLLIVLSSVPFWRWSKQCLGGCIVLVHFWCRQVFLQNLSHLHFWSTRLPPFYWLMLIASRWGTDVKGFRWKTTNSQSFSVSIFALLKLCYIIWLSAWGSTARPNSRAVLFSSSDEERNVFLGKVR